MGKAKRRRLGRKKESQPRLAALGSPFQGKGLAWTLPPSYGRRCPEGTEVGWGYRYPRRTKPSPMGKATKRECRYPSIVKANIGYVEKKNTDGQSLPRVGKVASGASRIGYYRYEKERERSSQGRRLRKHPIHRCAVPLPQWGRLRNENTAFLDTTPFPLGRQRGSGFAAKKKANPASPRSAAPSKGRGSRGRSLLP